MHLLEARYGTQSQYNYFIGGLTGVATKPSMPCRYPDDYHGAFAGYPAHNVVMLHLSANNYARALLANDGDSWISPAKVQNYVAAIYSTCDDLDRAGFGIISNVEACLEATEDFRSLSPNNPARCDGGRILADSCSSDTQIKALGMRWISLRSWLQCFADDESTTFFRSGRHLKVPHFLMADSPNLGADGPTSALQYGPGDATPRFAIAQDLTLDTMNDFDPLQNMLAE